MIQLIHKNLYISYFESLCFCDKVMQIYLCGKLLVLFRQDPRPGIEVVLFWEKVLHSPHCSTQVDLSQHFNHSCNAQVTFSDMLCCCFTLNTKGS